MACLKGRHCYALPLLVHPNATHFGTGLRTNSLKTIINRFLYARCPHRVRIPFWINAQRKKTPTKVDVFLFVACLKGFEPLTLWFVAKYSIQLSYKHILFIFAFKSGILPVCGTRNLLRQGIALHLSTAAQPCTLAYSSAGRARAWFPWPFGS